MLSAKHLVAFALCLLLLLLSSPLLSPQWFALSTNSSTFSRKTNPEIKVISLKNIVIMSYERGADLFSCTTS